MSTTAASSTVSINHFRHTTAAESRGTPGRVTTSMGLSVASTPLASIEPRATNLGTYWPSKDHYVNRVRGSFVLVVFAEPFAQAIRLHPHNRIFLLVEAGGPAQSLHGNVVFFDLLGLAFKILRADVG